MDLRSLECLLAVADTLHFGRAAHVVHLSQPAFSRRIAELESQVGAALLLRDRRSVSLTAAGVAFAAHARRCVQQAKAARAAALSAADGSAGILRLGHTVIAGVRHLPAQVAEFRRDHPLITVELVERDSDGLERALSDHRIDVALLHPPVGRVGIETASLPDEPLVLALPRSHPLARRRRPLTLESLDDLPFLLAPRRIGPALHARIVEAFRRAGSRLRVVQEVAPMTSLLGLVATGLGLGFVTESMARVPRTGVAFRDLDDFSVTLPMALAWRSGDLSQSARRFVAMIQAQ